MQIILKKLVGQLEKIKKLPRNIVGLHKLQDILDQTTFHRKETRELSNALKIFFADYLSGFSGLMLPLKKVIIPGAGLGQLFFRKAPADDHLLDRLRFAQIVEKRSTELKAEKAKINKLLWEKRKEYELEGKKTDEINTLPLFKDLLQIKAKYKHLLLFLEKLSAADLLAQGKLNESEKQELRYLYSLSSHTNIADDIKLVKRPVIIYLENLTVQDFSELSRCPEKIQAIIVQKKIPLGLTEMFKHLNIPLVQIAEPLMPEHQRTLVAVYGYAERKYLIVNPNKEICQDILNIQKVFKQDMLLALASEAQNIPVTVDKHHMRVLANLGSVDMEFPEEIKWMIKDNADGAGNIYTERLIPRYFEECKAWSTYTLEQKRQSRLVQDCLYPALKMVSAELARGYPKEKFQLHFRAFNIRQSKIDEEKYFSLLGVDQNDPQQKYELDLLKTDPTTLVYPLLEALILSLSRIETENGHELLPLVSYAVPNIQNSGDLELYEEWLATAFQNLGLSNINLLEKGVMFGAYVPDQQTFETFAAELFRRKIKYLLIDTSRWALDTLRQIVAEENLAGFAKVPMEIANTTLINMDSCLRIIYDKNNELPPAEKIRLINIGNLPKNYPLAAIYFSRTISVPLANLKNVIAQIRSVAYQTDNTWRQQNLTISYLLSDNKLLFPIELTAANVKTEIQNNIEDYERIQQRVIERVIEQKNAIAALDLAKLYETTALLSSTNLQQLRKELENKEDSPGSALQLPDNIVQVNEETLLLDFDITFPKGLHLRPSTTLAIACHDLSKYAEVKIVSADTLGRLDNFYKKEFGENFEKFDPLQVNSWSLLQLHYGDGLRLQIDIKNKKRIKLIKTVLSGLVNYLTSGDCDSILEY